MDFNSSPSRTILNIILFVLVISSSSLSSAREYLSAKRSPEFSFVQFAKLSQALEMASQARVGGNSESGTTLKSPQGETAFDQRVGYKDLVENLVPVSIAKWPATTPFDEVFKKVRDQRVLKADSNFPRRPSWLYPDDGCFARAEVVSTELQESGFPAPTKIFAFGDLKVKTKFSPVGYSTWWYHVVVGYLVKNEILVIDPSVDPTKPLRLKEWIQRMGGEAELSFCKATAIDPDSHCLNEPKIQQSEAFEMQTTFLASEWKNLLALNRDPKTDLGDAPPWLARPASDRRR